MHCFACVQKVFKSWILRFWVVCMRLSRRTSHYAFPSYHLHSFPSYYSSGFRSVWNFVCFLLFRLYSYSCWSSSVPIFFSLLSTTFSSRDNISMVFKIGSTVLQRTIYDPILEAILIPKYTYFHPQNLKIFHFWHKIVKLTYCIIFLITLKIEFSNQI